MSTKAPKVTKVVKDQIWKDHDDRAREGCSGYERLVVVLEVGRINDGSDPGSTLPQGFARIQNCDDVGSPNGVFPKTRIQTRNLIKKFAYVGMARKRSR